MCSLCSLLLFIPVIYSYNKDIQEGSLWMKFLQNIAHVDQKRAQLIMAKVTGNFKHGNERKEV